jgi:hypothetical protein
MAIRDVARRHFKRTAASLIRHRGIRALARSLARSISSIIRDRMKSSIPRERGKRGEGSTVDRQPAAAAAAGGGRAGRRDTRESSIRAKRFSPAARPHRSTG